MRSYNVVLRRVNSDDEEECWVSVLVGHDESGQQCFLRQTKRYKECTRADALSDLYQEMVIEMRTY